MATQTIAAGRIPSLHIVADSIPQAHFRAMKAVWDNGLAIRTEYDRKNDRGEYIDPPSRDARVLIEITDPLLPSLGSHRFLSARSAPTSVRLWASRTTSSSLSMNSSRL